MGIQSSSNLEQNRIQKYWQSLSNQNEIEIFKNKGDGTLAEKRQVSINPIYQISDEIEIYTYRAKNLQGLVRTYQVEEAKEVKNRKNSSINNLCSSQRKLIVLSERIIYRLSELPQLTFGESLLILKQSAVSFGVIYEKFGPCHINSDLIGVNQKFQIRVWMNENWALNHPSHSINTLFTTSSKVNEYNFINPQLRDQKQMIQNLIDVVESKTEQGRYPLQFNQLIRQNSTNFKQFDAFLKQYSSQTKSYIPNLIRRSRILVDKNDVTRYQSQLVKRQKSTNKDFDVHGNINFINHFEKTKIEPMYQPLMKTNEIKIPQITHNITTHYENIPSSHSISMYNYNDIPKTTSIYQNNFNYQTNIGKTNSIWNFENQYSSNSNNNLSYKFTQPTKIQKSFPTNFQFKSPLPTFQNHQRSINQVSNLTEMHLQGEKVYNFDHFLPKSYKPLFQNSKVSEKNLNAQYGQNMSQVLNSQILINKESGKDLSEIQINPQ